MHYKVSDSDLKRAVEEGIISEGQFYGLRSFLMEKDSTKDGFNFVNLFYYLGAITVMMAMTWFVVDAWDSFSGATMSIIALIYGLCFALPGYRVFKNSSYILGGLLITMSVCMTPLFIYGIQKQLGLWGGKAPGDYNDFYYWIKSGWFYMELVSLLVSLFAIRLVRFSFLAAPMAVVLWFMSMDIAPLLNVDRDILSVLVGISMISSALACDFHRDKIGVDYGFWIHLFGALAFWGGLSMMDSKSELSRFVYCMINVFLMIGAIGVRRRIYLILGAIGFYGYLGHLAWTVFDEYIYFPFILATFGLAVMASGVWFHKKKEKIDLWIVSKMPDWLKIVHDMNE